MRKQFEITYRSPKSGKLRKTIAEFEDSPCASAREWASDYAYTLADKGWFKIRELPDWTNK